MSRPANMRAKSGDALHPIGIGTWGFGEYPIFSPGAEAEINAITYAINLGQNHIDTAEMYAGGGAEHVVGRATKSVNRRTLFIASKLWKNHVAKDEVRPAVVSMLKRLDTDYLDILYIHAPWFDAPWQEAIPQIDALIDEGLVRHSGVSNFNADRLREALSIARHPIVADQLHYSCMHQQEVTPELRELCTANDIAIVAYMPLEKGKIQESRLLKQIARRYDASPAQVALAWTLTQHAVPIPKALQKAHIYQNAMADNTKLLREDVYRISRLLGD